MQTYKELNLKEVNRTKSAWYVQNIHRQLII
jgi:hypothetical protein